MASSRKAQPAQSVARYTPEEDRRAILLKTVEADLNGSDLEKWEEQFCRWLALHGNMHRKRQIEVASALAGAEITSQQLVQLRCRSAWKALWIKERNVETALKRAKADFSVLIESAPAQYKKMLGKAIQAEDVRAATPLLVPLMERAIPKKDDSPSAAPSVHIHLSLAQAKGLESVPLDVSAEEIAEFTVEES
jgi:hypothetical protein